MRGFRDCVSVAFSEEYFEGVCEYESTFHLDIHLQFKDVCVEVTELLYGCTPLVLVAVNEVFNLLEA